MKSFGRKFWIVLPAFALCAGLVVFAACEDDECRECTNKKDSSKKEKMCGDDLIEALRPDSDWTCK